MNSYHIIILFIYWHHFIIIKTPITQILKNILIQCIVCVIYSEIVRRYVITYGFTQQYHSPISNRRIKFLSYHIFIYLLLLWFIIFVWPHKLIQSLESITVSYKNIIWLWSIFQSYRNHEWNSSHYILYFNIDY